MTADYINNRGVRFNRLKKEFNLRWPDKDNDVAGVFICKNEADIINEDIISIADNNKRIIVHSGGYCYEGFVSNNTFNTGMRCRFP
ncbi:hypothetical protein ID854_20960 [Xenorhabdus sp. M]|uniref:Uncharacterized protein n=1 Tax=Xenorhabdus szentirmaii TaxID=290112 RepID=A0AAW3YZS2_9GAMM|nr:hypothetical protein [Xenorhabdus sp. M]MBD2802846.1 hypothetical protein [Xenorhabdus sp. M]